MKLRKKTAVDIMIEADRIPKMEYCWLDVIHCNRHVEKR